LPTYIYTYEHIQTHKRTCAHSNIYTTTHTHTRPVAHAHTNTERERDGISHDQNAHRYTHAKTSSHTVANTHTYTHEHTPEHARIRTYTTVDTYRHTHTNICTRTCMHTHTLSYTPTNHETSHIFTNTLTDARSRARSNTHTHPSARTRIMRLTPCLIGVATSPLNPHPPHLVMGSSAENDGVRVRGEQCVYSSGAHCICSGVYCQWYSMPCPFIPNAATTT
jgi:hypothetical protein